MQKETIVDNLIRIWQEKEIIKPLPAEGKSMYPLIKHGDKVYIKFCKPEKIKVGDIVAFRRGNTTIVHRLLKKIDSSIFLEKGDFQRRAQPVEQKHILGKVLLAHSPSSCMQGLGSPILPRWVSVRVDKIINPIMAYLGYLIHKLSFIDKPLLVFPLTINIIFIIISKKCRQKFYIKEKTEYLPAD